MVLPKDVVNPKPDRRYGVQRWEFYPIWFAGMTPIFLNTDTFENKDGSTFETVTLEYMYHRVGPHRVPDLMAALKVSE